ncbi:vacuolar protein sorting-associated protein [Aureococcus anophagefferens]|uniref:Vacuolar protein sorting-associated protein n=1 Tax=Aureococcus anophagefferens TaxID=44056 RepID=A0ABR1G3F2_AURAN
MLALWPLGGLALVALALYGVAFPRGRASRSRSRRRASARSVSFAKPDLAARFEARDLRGDGRGAGAASVAFSLTRFGVEVLAGGARETTLARARRRLGGGARRAMIREGVLELAFDGYKKDRGFPVFTATLKETRFVYEHHFIAEAVVGFLFGGFRRAQRCVPRRPVDAYATFFEHWQSELVVDFGDVVWEQRGAAGPRAASVADAESADHARRHGDDDASRCTRRSAGPFCRRRGAGPPRRLAEPCELRYDRRATFATSDFDAAPYESASEASLAGKEGPVDVCGDGADARALLDVVAALARDDPAPGAPEAVVMLWAASPWAADLGRVDLSPPAHADSRGTFAARVVVRAHALAFRARAAAPRAELARGVDAGRGIAVSAEDHFGAEEEQPAVTLDGALLVAGDEDHFSRAPPARTTSRDAAPEPDDDDVREARPWSVEISLGPLLVFRNGLPVPLAWELVGGGRRRGVLPADAEAPYRGDAPSVSLRVRIANYAWSPPLEIALRDVFDAANAAARAPPAAGREGKPPLVARVMLRLDALDATLQAPAGVERARAPSRASSSPSTRRAPWLGCRAALQNLLDVAATYGACADDLDALLDPPPRLRVCHALEATLDAQDRAPPVAFATDAARARALVADWGAVVPWDPCAAARRVATEPIRVVFCDASKAPVDLPPPAVRVSSRGFETSAPLALPCVDAASGRLGARRSSSARSGRAAAGGAARRRRRARDDDGALRGVDDADSGGKSAPHTHRAAREADAAAASLSLNCPRPRGACPRPTSSPWPSRADGAGARAARFATLLPRVTVRNGLADCVLEVGQVAVDGGDHAPAQRALPTAAAGGRRTGDDTLAVVERADERWPPYRIANGTSRVVRYRQKLGSATFGLAVAISTGELAAGRRRRRRRRRRARPRRPVAGPRGPRGDAHGGPGRRRARARGQSGGAAETSPTFAAKRPSSTLGAAAETLEKNAHSLRDALVGGAASALLGGDPKAPRRKSTYASEAYESAQSTAKYLGSKVHKGARKMGVVAASHEEQTVAPWTELRPNDEHVYAWERPLDAIGYGSKSYRRALQVEFYDATRDEWGSNLNVPLDALSTAAAPSKEAKLRRAAGAAAPDLGAAGLDYRPVERRHPYLPETWVGGVAAVDASTAVLYVFGDAKRSFLAAVADLRTEARDGNPVEPRCVAFVAPGRPVSAPAKKGLGYKMTRWTHGDDGEAPSRDELRDAIDADFEGRGPLVESDECPVVLFVFLELKRRYAGAEVVSVEVWSERLSALPLVTRLVAEEFLVPDAGGGFSTAGYALADRDADADRASSPYVCVASPKDGVLASLKAKDAAAARRWVADLRDAVDGAGRVDARLTLDDVASSSRVVCVVRADGPTKVLEISEEGAVRLHALDVRLTLKGGLTSTGRAEVARAFGGTSQVDAAAAAVGQLDATALGVDALLIDDAYAATAESLGRRVARHYALNLLRQVHRVCGSLDLVTKTPLHVARAVGGGLGDFLWRPVEGAATGSALGLASGVARGTGALIGGVYDGSLGAVSSLTAGVGATVAALSMDSNYVAKRAISRAAEQNAKKGRKGGSEAVAREVYRGASELGAGIFDGLTGVVVEPYRAASSGGDAAAIARATARGLLGVAVKPAVGLLDLANRGVEGVRVAGKVVHDTFQEAAPRRRAPPRAPQQRRRRAAVCAAAPAAGVACGDGDGASATRGRGAGRRGGAPSRATAPRVSDRRVCGARDGSDDEGDVLVAYVEDAVAGLERRCCDAVWEARLDGVFGRRPAGGGDDVRVLVRDGPADGDGGRRLAIGDAAVALEARLAQRLARPLGAARARALPPRRAAGARGGRRALARQPAARVRRARLGDPPALPGAGRRYDRRRRVAALAGADATLLADDARRGATERLPAALRPDELRRAARFEAARALGAVRVRLAPGARADYAGERWLRDDGDLDALVLLFPTEGAARA